MARTVGGAEAPPTFSVSTPKESPLTHADREPAHPQAADRAEGEDEDAGASRSSAEAGRLHARLHDDAEEAELGPSQGRARPADERDGGRLVHPGGGAQPPG